MSNNEYEDDDDTDLTTESLSNDLVKQLRKANKQKDKELAELKASFESLNKAQRERAIKDTLAARGVNTKISSFIPQDIDPTEESVSKWLESNADVFGLKTEEVPQKPNVDPAQAAAYKKMTNAVEQGVTPEHNEDILKKLLNANTREELDAIIKGSGL
jgi:molybdopterin biosynthesis enzyme MoaB